MTENKKTTQNFQLGHFFWMCSLFSVLIVITLFVADIFVKAYDVNTYRYKHQRLTENSSDISTLILGNSLTYYGIIPSILADSAFNLANVSQDFKYDNLVLNNYPFENLHNLIIQISIASFTDRQFEDSKAWIYARYYKMYMGIDEHSDFSRYNFELSLFPNFLSKLHSIFKKKPEITCDSDGFGINLPYERRKTNMDTLGKKLAELNTAPDFSQVEIQKEKLAEIIKYCKRRGVRLVFITPPAWRSYRENYDPRQYALMKHLADSISKAENIDYFDFLSDGRFKEEDFFDPVHLNERGARKFSRILRDTLFLRKR